jgi:uncharacterized protein (UPF0254 family)
VRRFVMKKTLLCLMMLFAVTGLSTACGKKKASDKAGSDAKKEEKKKDDKAAPIAAENVQKDFQAVIDAGAGLVGKGVYLIITENEITLKATDDKADKDALAVAGKIKNVLDKYAKAFHMKKDDKDLVVQLNPDSKAACLC